MASDCFAATKVSNLWRGGMKSEVRISAPVITAIRKEARRSEDGSETGGILLGFEDSHAGCYWVTEAGQPGPQAERSPIYFCRDLDHAESLAERAFSIDGSQWIGDWHTHPDGPSCLSHIDLQSYRKVLANSDLKAFLAILVLPGPAGWNDSRVGAFRVSASNVECIPIRDLLGARNRPDNPHR
jgi:integrative and conjugative element protein (TIGR02256 family)